jgi:hypothetical protein
MRDIERFQAGYPKATLFDGEVFLIGWEAGARYGRGSSGREDRGERSQNPPERNIVPDSQDERRRV